MTEVIETTLLRGRLKLLQPKQGFHASTDTVLLAAAVGENKANRKQKMLDLGCGVGSIGLCVTLNNSNILLTGLDIQEGLVGIAHQNATLNQMSDRCRFFSGNLAKERQIEDNFFDLAVCNPPYQEAGTHTPSPRLNKALSHGEDASETTLKDWCKYLHKKVKQGGFIYMIHRADRLDDVIVELTGRRWFGSLVVLPIHSREGEPAKRVIVKARKERYAPIKLLPALVMHEKDGSYTKAATQILDGKAFIDM
jgi:tRNA1(Val) A37 N6-methylase TrmN6